MTNDKPASDGGAENSARKWAELAAAVFEGVNVPPKPSLLRRALNRVKRAFRYRSAKDGEFVTKAYAEANPDTTIREKAD